MPNLTATGCDECDKTGDARAVHMHEDFTLRAPSSSGGWYVVSITCECIGAKNGAVCKHIYGAIRLKETLHKAAVRKGVETRSANRAAASVEPGASPAVSVDEPAVRMTETVTVDGSTVLTAFGANGDVLGVARITRSEQVDDPEILKRKAAEWTGENVETQDADEWSGDYPDEPFSADWAILNVGDSVRIAGRGVPRFIRAIHNQKMKRYPYSVQIATLSDGQKFALKMLVKVPASGSPRFGARG